jgi:hypothetical protein
MDETTERESKGIAGAGDNTMYPRRDALGTVPTEKGFNHE